MTNKPVKMNQVTTQTEDGSLYGVWERKLMTTQPKSIKRKGEQKWIKKKNRSRQEGELEIWGSRKGKPVFKENNKLAHNSLNPPVGCSRRLKGCNTTENVQLVNQLQPWHHWFLHSYFYLSPSVEEKKEPDKICCLMPESVSGHVRQVKRLNHTQSKLQPNVT